MSAEEIKRITGRFLSSAGTSEVVKSFSTGGWEMSGVSSNRGGGVTAMGEKARKKSGPEEDPKTLMVTDFANVMDKIAAVIKQLDIKPAQILIDAMIVEIGSDYVRDIGIEWNATQNHNIADVTYGFATLKPLTEGLVVDYTRSHVTAKIMAMEQAGKADILSNPRIMTLDNYPAVIMVGEKYPIMTTTLTSDPSGNGKVIATGALDHYEPIGIILRVIPHVNGAGVIELILHPEVTSLGDAVSSGSGDGALVLPRINSRETDTIVTTKDGQTVVIGGLLTKNVKQIVRKIPLLGDIPLLGHLFKRTVKESKKVELMIFITPQITNDPANANQLLIEKSGQIK
jgi:general secretion pathway protein D